MARIIDLTHVVTNAMPVFPGDPEVIIRPSALGAEKQYLVSKVTIGTHTGTHVDAPRHLMPQGISVDQLDIGSLIGWAQVLDLPRKSECSEIGVSDLRAFEKQIGEGSRLLLCTGWGKYFGQPRYFTDFPGISEEAAEWLASRRIGLLGIEQPSTHPVKHRQTHEILLSRGVVLVESLANLQELTMNRVYLIVLPLKLLGADGAPARVVAIEED